MKVLGSGVKEYMMQADKIRAFIAVEIPDHCKEAMQRIQDGFRSTRGRVSWVRPEGMHITLKFLGDIEERRIPEIEGEIREVCAGRPAFPVCLRGTGVFPDLRRPRVLWIGMREGADELKELFADLDLRLARMGFAREDRAFHPHVTLGRIKLIQNLQGFSALVEKNREAEAGSMTADSVCLIQSELHPEGAVYTPRLSVPLMNESK